MDSSCQPKRRTSRTHQFSIHVPSPHLRMTFSRASARMWAAEIESNRQSPFRCNGLRWPTKCHCKDMKKTSSTSTFQPGAQAVQDGRDDAAKGFNS